MINLKHPVLNEKANRWLYTAYFAAFTICIIAGAFFYYNLERDRVRHEKYNELAEITHLKTGQLVQWKNERLGDSKVLLNNSLVKNDIYRFLLGSRDDRLTAGIYEFLKSYVLNYDYLSAILVDASMTTRMSYPQGQSVPESYLKKYIKDSFSKGKIVFSDIHKSKEVPVAHFDVLIPLKMPEVNDSTLFGVIVLRVDPSKILFPLIQTWPVPTKTSETLLVEAKGDSVIFMNNLLHSPVPALDLKMPVSDRDLPAAAAVRGYQGPFEGKDYRGVRVVSYIARVPDTQWYMIAKVDKTEIYSSLKYRAGVVIIITILLIISAGMLTGLFLRSRSLNLYKARAQLQAEKLAAEEKFRQISARLEAILDSVPNIIMEVNASKVYTWANQAGFDFFGDDVIGKEASLYFEGENDVYSVVKPLFNGTSEKVYVESFQRRKDGEIRLLAWWCKAIHDETGKTAGTLSSATDITEQNKAGLALKESEAKFRNMFEYSPLGKSMTGIDGSIHVNKAFCTLLGYTEDELRNKSWRDITHPEDITETENILNSMMAGILQEARFEKRYIHKNGTIIFTDISTYLHRDASNNPTFFITTVNDITARKKAETAIRASEERMRRMNEELEERVAVRTAELKAINRELEAFTYTVSHDLRSPLRAIHSFTSILKEEYARELDDEGKRLCGIIESGAVRMGTLIDDLLAFSRAGRIELMNSEVDMEYLAKTAFAELTAPADRERIDLSINSLPVIHGDVSTLKQVWTNLISNALKYSSKRDKAVIRIGSEQKDGENIFFIKDNGTGFDMKYSGKLFGVFQRLHNQKDFEGNGVGLAIVQRIINRHNGHVWAEGEADKGAVFYFSLPAGIRQGNDADTQG